MMGNLLLGFVAGSGFIWAFMELRRDEFWRKYNARRRGSNPPPLGRKPAPPAGPPEQPLQAQLIRFWGWQADQVARAWSDPRLGDPWEGENTDQERQATDALATQLEEDGKYLIAAGLANECIKTRDLGVRVIRAATLLAGGHAQRGNGNGGPTTPKPPIKPQSSGGRQLPILFP
jgi:hypothetical protein